MASLAQVGLDAEARLRVLDPCSAPPFIHAADDGYVAVFDGVLYNGKELQVERQTPAANPAETILGLYRAFGERMLGRIKGLFALIVWDPAHQTLLCARDPLGIYPLFYAQTGGELLLSVSIEALRRDRRVLSDVNRTAMAGYLSHRWPDVGETFFAAIHRVPPGHAMRVDRTGCHGYRYWDPVPPDAEPEWVTEKDLGRFEELLGDAVARFMDFGPAAIFLSGGLDSVTVAAIAADINRRRGAPLPLALSMVFPHPDCNEESVQKQVASALALSHRLLSFDEAVGPRGLLVAALEMSSRLPSPLQNVWHPAYERLALAGKGHGCEVILTGGGGDEWLAVTPVYAADLLCTVDVVGLYRLVRSIQRSYRLPALPLLRNVLWTNGARLLLREAFWWSLHRAAGIPVLRGPSKRIIRARRLRQQRMIPDWLVPDHVLRQEIGSRAEASTGGTSWAPERGSFYFRELRQALNHPLTSLELEEIFENGRRLGMRILQPFWDADLVDFLSRVPPRLLNKGGRSKGLVRETLHRRFSNPGFGHQKKIVSIDFFRSIMLREGAGAWRAMGGAPALAELGLVDARLLGTTFEDILAGRRFDQVNCLWDILNLESWLRPRL